MQDFKTPPGVFSF